MRRIIHALIIAALGVALWSCSAVPRSNPSTQSSYSPIEFTAMTLPELADAIRGREVAAEQVAQAYLDRIERIDRNGPRLQSIITLNPDALNEARALDALRASGADLGSLHGIPILLKDNIESKDNMPTTAGALALKDNFTGRDSPLVAGLREAGAIVLGKANLSQWANFRSNDSMSGWSALGGQVRNPHMLDRNPCGSSSGSASAIAASLAAGAVGTETNGSIICPAQIGGIVGFKPTVGLVSQQYIVPISFSQDAAGPMTRSVRGAAMMLTAMATGSGRRDFTDALDKDALGGIRIGVARFAQGSHPVAIERFNMALTELEAAGATLVEIESFENSVDDFWNQHKLLLEYEFKASLNDYLAGAPSDLPVRSLAALLEFNRAHADVELALFGQDIFESANDRGSLNDYAYIGARAAIQSATREKGIDHLLRQHDVDVLLSPSGPVAPRIDPINGDVWPAWAGIGWMAAVAGYPHLTVPMGTVHGIPIGLSFIGTKHQDAQILAFGYAFEQRTLLRPKPGYLPSAEARNEIGSAMIPVVARP